MDHPWSQEVWIAEVPLYVTGPVKLGHVGTNYIIIPYHRIDDIVMLG